MPADASEASIVKLSLPSPPTTVRLASEAGDTDCAMPSIVTTTFVPSKAALIVCAPEPDAVRVSEAGAAAGRSVAGAGGGDTPLAVFAFGSGVVQSVPAGAVVAPSVCVAGVEATPLPAESHEPVPVTPAMPVDDPAPGPLPGWPDWDDDDSCVPVGSVALVVTGAVTELEPSAPVDVEVVLVATVLVVEPLGKDTELLPDPPTTAVSTGGEIAAVIAPDVPAETAPVCGDVIVDVPDEEICVPADASPAPAPGCPRRRGSAAGRRRSSSPASRLRPASASRASTCRRERREPEPVAPPPEPSRPAVAPPCRPCRIRRAWTGRGRPGCSCARSPSPFRRASSCR